ncbi:MAG: acyl carrier protein [Clostridiales bacterium]|jgi:acyl carrier protein|nr:acyl carrier protein [Clostridiales bacterium]
MVFENIAQVISDRTDTPVEEITLESKIKDLGIDSLDSVELLLELEDRLGHEFDIDRKVETVSDLVALVEEQMKQ